MPISFCMGRLEWIGTMFSTFTDPSWHMFCFVTNQFLKDCWTITFKQPWSVNKSVNQMCLFSFTYLKLKRLCWLMFLPCWMDISSLYGKHYYNFSSGKMLPLIICLVLVKALAAAFPTLLSSTLWVWSVFIFANSALWAELV